MCKLQKNNAQITKKISIYCAICHFSHTLSTLSSTCFCILLGAVDLARMSYCWFYAEQKHQYHGVGTRALVFRSKIFLLLLKSIKKSHDTVAERVKIYEKK